MAKTKFATVGKDEDGVVGELTLAIVPPSARQKNDAKLYSLRAFNDAVKAGVMVKDELEGHLKKRDLWDDARQAEFERLRRSILAGELTLKKGGRKLSDMRPVAIKMSRDRAALQDLLSARSDLETKTADALADQAYFNFLVACCTVYNAGRFEGKPYFSPDAISPSVDLYIERSNEQAAYDAASKLSEIVYGKAADILAQMPENQFLRRFRFIDDDFNFIDKDGRRVDESGRRIDEQGFLLNEDGGRVDEDGNPVDEDGQYAVEFSPFLDDDGNPIVDEGALPAPALTVVAPEADEAA